MVVPPTAVWLPDFGIQNRWEPYMIQFVNGAWMLECRMHSGAAKERNCHRFPCRHCVTAFPCIWGSRTWKNVKIRNLHPQIIKLRCEFVQINKLQRQSNSYKRQFQCTPHGGRLFQLSVVFPKPAALICMCDKHRWEASMIKLCCKLFPINNFQRHNCSFRCLEGNRKISSKSMHIYDVYNAPSAL